MIKSLKKVSSNAAGNLQVIPSPIIDHRFRVDGILIKVAVSMTAAAATLALRETYGHAWRVDLKYADGTKFYDDVSFTGAELIAEQTAKNYLTKPEQLLRPDDDSDVQFSSTSDLDNSSLLTLGAAIKRHWRKEITNRALAAGANVVYFRLWLPLARPNASNPVDFSQSLSMLGELNVKVTNDTGAVNTTVNGFSVEVLAVGERVDNFYAGIRVKHSMSGSQAPLVGDDFALNGGRLLALQKYTIDVAGSPLLGANPHIELDNGHVLVDLNDAGQLETDLNELSTVVAGEFPADSERQMTNAALVVAEPYKFSIFDLPVSDKVRCKYSSNAATGSKHFAVISAAVAKADRCRATIYPGAKNLTPAQLDAAIRIVARSPLSAEALLLRKDWLPEEVLTNEARGATCG